MSRRKTGVVEIPSKVAKSRGNLPITGKFPLECGAVGGIRTLGRLLTYTRFPVVLVMTASIPLRIQLLLAGAFANRGQSVEKT